MTRDNVEPRRLEAVTTIPFRGFDEQRQVRIYASGVMPHWRQDGCTYFVTFRQGDSIPAAKMREFEYERRCWLRARGIDPEDADWKSKFAGLPSKEKRIYERFVGFTLDKHLDAAHGSCKLLNSQVAKIVGDAMTFFHGERLLSGDFVIMPNHCHALMRPLPGWELEDILHSIKSYSSQKINRLLGLKGMCWQKESYDHIVRDFEQLEAFVNYIAANPVKAGLRKSQFVHRRCRYVPE